MNKEAVQVKLVVVQFPYKEIEKCIFLSVNGKEVMVHVWILLNESAREHEMDYEIRQSDSTQMKEKHVYIIRHGESDANEIGINLGDKARLTQKGYNQAIKIAERVSKIPNIEVVISSPLDTAKQTAEVISQFLNLPLESNELFIQRRRPTCILGKKHIEPDVKEIMDEIYLGYLKPNYRYSDEENLDDMQFRVSNVLDFLNNHKAERICVVTHGTILWEIFWAIFSGREFSGRDFQKALLSLEIENNSITHIRYEEPNIFMPKGSVANWRIISWNSSGLY